MRFYQECDANSNLLDRSNSKIYPVCLHPRFGGWFALRGVFIFPNIQIKKLNMSIPSEILSSPDEVSELLNLYNYHWKNNQFRDCGNIEERYSEEQIQYFAIHPGSQRTQYLAKLLHKDISV